MLKILLFVGACSAARVSRQFMHLEFAPGHPFQSTYYPNYLLHNIFQVDPNRLIQGIISDGRPGISPVQSPFHYFFTPVYDDRIHLSPLFPNYQQMIPSYIPQKPSRPPQMPPLGDDGIEKLDEKLDPAMPDHSNGENIPQNDDDTVTIEAI